MAPSNDSPALLLLPSPPQPSTRAALDAAYRAPLTAVLAKLKNKASSETLVVAVACPILKGASPKNKTLCWKTAQSLLAGVYTVISVVCAKEGIATEINGGPGSVDTRVVLVDHDPGRRYYPDLNGAYEANNTTVLDLPAFAARVHPWKTIYHPNCEEGYELLSSYLKFAEGKQTLLQHQLVVVEGGVSFTTQPHAVSEAEKGYGTLCLGGTFDHLHPGHKLLLEATVLLLTIPEKESKKQSVLIVGISGDDLLKNKKYAEELEPWETRARGVLSFLSTLLEYSTSPSITTTSPQSDELHAKFRDDTVLVRCVNIPDPFGPTITEEAIDAIVVSGETRSGGQAINDKRLEKGWKGLEVYEIDVLDAREIDDDHVQQGATKTESFAAKISSTAIRQKRAEAKRRQ